MKVELALLADYAEVSQRGGKLIVCGIFDRITLADVDAVHPHMALALKLACEVGESSVHHLSVRLVDPDGVDVVQPMKGDVEVKGEADGDASVNLILDLNLVKFRIAGPHSFDVFLDGELEKQVPLSVERLERIDPLQR
jgi:hypothetical protein